MSGLDPPIRSEYLTQSTKRREKLEQCGNWGTRLDGERTGFARGGLAACSPPATSADSGGGARNRAVIHRDQHDHRGNPRALWHRRVFAIPRGATTGCSTAWAPAFVQTVKSASDNCLRGSAPFVNLHRDGVNRLAIAFDWDDDAQLEFQIRQRIHTSAEAGRDGNARSQVSRRPSFSSNGRSYRVPISDPIPGRERLRGHGRA